MSIDSGYRHHRPGSLISLLIGELSGHAWGALQRNWALLSSTEKKYKGGSYPYHQKKSRTWLLVSELSILYTCGTRRDRETAQLKRENENPAHLLKSDGGVKINSKTIGDYMRNYKARSAKKQLEAQPEALLREENSGPLVATTHLSASSNIIASRIIYCPQLLIITGCTGEVK